MQILKYKKMSSGKYKIELDNGINMELYEEVILKHELLLKKSIDQTMIPIIQDSNLEWEVYYVALKSIKQRFKSAYDLRSSLVKKEYPVYLVDKAVNKLLEQGYLNDASFAKGYINNQIITSSKGPNSISNDLRNKGIDEKIIREEIVVFDRDLQKSRIKKIIDKNIKSNRNKGGSVLKNKIITNLLNLGYDLDIVQMVISNYQFGNDIELAKKEYDKLYKKLSRKYSGEELKYKIKEKLYQKGLKYEEVD